MNKVLTPTIFFFKVKSNSAKLELICKKSVEAYEQKKRLLIFVPNLKSAHYIDRLLWHFSAESFVPHVVTDMPTAEWIAITLQNKINVNKASHILNLTGDISGIFEQIEEVFEVFDETSEEKTQQSREKIHLYQSREFKTTLLD